MHVYCNDVAASPCAERCLRPGVDSVDPGGDGGEEKDRRLKEKTVVPVVHGGKVGKLPM